MNLLRARISFERELACRWPLGFLSWGLVAVGAVASPRWREGWLPFMLILLAVMVALAAVRTGSLSDSWFQSLGGSTFADFLGRVAAHSALVAIPVMLGARTITPALRWDMGGRTYVLGVLVLYVALTAGRGIFRSTGAVVGAVAAALAIGASTLLADQIRDAWPLAVGLVLRAALLVVPTILLALRWESIGSWRAHVSSTSAWVRVALATIIGTLGLAGAEVTTRGPLGPVSSEHSADGSRALFLPSGEDWWESYTGWIWTERALQPVPGGRALSAAFGPRGSIGVLSTEDPQWKQVTATLYDATLTEIAHASLDEAWSGSFSPSGDWLVPTSTGAAIFRAGGSVATIDCTEAVWLGDDVLARRGLELELVRRDGAKVALVDRIPAFLDPALDLNEGPILWPRSGGRVLVRTESKSCCSLGFLASRVDEACASGPGCPGLLEPLSGSHLELGLLDCSAWADVKPEDGTQFECSRNAPVVRADGTFRNFGDDVVDYARDGRVVRRYRVATKGWLSRLAGWWLG